MSWEGMDVTHQPQQWVSDHDLAPHMGFGPSK